MKGRPIDQLVYECMFPKPKPGDPQNFHDLLRRQLVPEVRHETACFYGALDSREAQYPGLDYSFPPHRMRLSRFTWHRRLFRALDALQLTPAEIAGLTKWEGTRWAKERFEKEQGIRIRDTTGDCIHDWVNPELRQQNRNIPQAQEAQVEEMEDVEEEGDTEEMDEDAEDSDMEIDSSVGVELNERLRAAAAEREAGNSTTVMDEEWEQWLKEAAEAGGIPSISHHTSNPNNASGEASTSGVHPRLLHAARLGQWHQIPDFLQVMVRRNIEANNQRGSASLAQRSDAHSSTAQSTQQLPVVVNRATPRSRHPLILPSNMPARQTSTGNASTNRSSLSSRLLEQRFQHHFQHHVHHQPQS